jgi:hypothetical protein
LCFDIRLTYVFAGFLMQMEEAEGNECIIDEEQPKDVGNNKGPLVPRDGGSDVPNMVEGHQDMTKGDGDHEL